MKRADSALAFDRAVIAGALVLLCLWPPKILSADGPVTSQALTAAQRAAEHDERQKADHQHSERLLAYLAKQFPHEVTAASADADRITIEGRLGKNPGDLRLAEVPMWQDVTALNAPEALLPIDSDAQGRFVVSVERHGKDGRDRLLSAWCLVRKTGERYEPVSAIHYVDRERARADLPPAKPRSIKGLGGCPFDSPDMKELGIASVTLNIVLNDIIYAEPAPGRSAYVYSGHTWYIADNNVANYDRYMRTAADHGWMVSAIILMSRVRNAPQNAWIRDAAHPEADPSGIYVMPNFTSRAGVEAYAAVMNFLAERYSRPDEKFGRIHDWILHNEINSGFYWTNAGDKTLITYLDLYQKSLRLTLLIARQYDPHAKPLISLDHYWNKNPDPRGYPARELLDRLVDFSNKEGDFEWGIAFHPYAQDLFNPRTWEDSQATFDFDAPVITFKNIEVLDAWVRQPRARFRGQEFREIQLTEQGLNSRDYSESALREQAAGLAYAWKKIHPLKTITAFQYHLWADNRGEGGLRLGLRKFSDDAKDPLGKKPSWDVYRVLDTDQEDAGTAFAKPMIGIKDWSEVAHRGDIPSQAGLFVAVGYGGFRGWSADGETWTAERWSDKNADDINIIFSLTERNGILLCSGGGVGKGFILRSTDGKHWNEVVRTKWRIAGVLGLSDRFISVFDDAFQTSSDGIKWQRRAAAIPTAPDGKGGGYFRRWAAGKGRAVFAGDYALGGDRPRVGWLGSTKLGETPLVLEKEPADVCGLEFGNDRFIACTTTGQILTSDDGEKFTDSGSSGDQHDDGAVRFVDGKFYLIGRHGMKSSTDGKTWEQLAKPPHLPRAVAPNGVAIDCGWGGIQVAPDGKTFHKAQVPIDPTGITSVLYFVPAANRAAPNRAPPSPQR